MGFADNGKTFYEYSIIPFDNMYHQYGNLIFRPDGSLVFYAYNERYEQFLTTLISHDNGKTWSAPQRIYTGLTWEPSALEADNGEIYVYFTAVAPTIHLYGYAVALFNNFIRADFDIALDFFVVEFAANQTLDAVNSILRVGDTLTLGNFAYQAFAFFGNGDY